MSKSGFLQAWVEITEDLNKRMALAAAYRRAVETFAIELKNLIEYYNERTIPSLYKETKMMIISSEFSQVIKR